MSNTIDIIHPRTVRIYGHFGEWLQGRSGLDGDIVLISVTCPVYWAEITCQSANSFGYVDPIPSLNSANAQALIEALGLDRRIDIAARTNMKAGAGMGASTASLVALAKASGACDLDDASLISAVLEIEGASDPLMLPEFDRDIWASRKGKVVSSTPPLPKFEVIGGTWGEPKATDPQDSNFPDISDLLAEWEPAVKKRSVHNISEISTESFRRNSEMRDFAREPTLDIAAQLGALGVIHAHTGSARGFLFAPGTVPASGLDQIREAGYADPIKFETGGG